MMDRKDLEAWAADVMSRSEMVVLATMGSEPYPHQRALFNFRNAAKFPALADYQKGKGLKAYLGTNTSSIKVRQVGADPWISVYYMIPAEFKGLCLSGRAVPDLEARAALWEEGWEMYYPQGRNDPDYTVLRLDPVRARGWGSTAHGMGFDFEL